jgi:hypothetical protein
VLALSCESKIPSLKNFKKRELFIWRGACGLTTMV